MFVQHVSALTCAAKLHNTSSHFGVTLQQAQSRDIVGQFGEAIITIYCNQEHEPCHGRTPHDTTFKSGGKSTIYGVAYPAGTLSGLSQSDKPLVPDTVTSDLERITHIEFEGMDAIYASAQTLATWIFNANHKDDGHSCDLCGDATASTRNRIERIQKYAERYGLFEALELS